MNQWQKSSRLFNRNLLLFYPSTPRLYASEEIACGCYIHRPETILLWVVHTAIIVGDLSEQNNILNEDCLQNRHESQESEEGLKLKKLKGALTA